MPQDNRPDADIRILVVDDHPVVRRGIRALLATEPGMQVVGEADDGSVAVQETEKQQPDVVLMDLVMEGMDGVEAIRRIRARHPDIAILVLTSFGSDDKLFPAIKAGALGYLLKDANPTQLVEAIRNAARGRTTLDQSVAHRLLEEFSRDREAKPPSEPLTAREGDVLRQLARGRTNDEIAAELFISEATVRTHVSSIFTKLHLNNRTQAALYALRAGVISLDDIPE